MYLLSHYVSIFRRFCLIKFGPGLGWFLVPPLGDVDCFLNILVLSTDQDSGPSISSLLNIIFIQILFNLYRIVINLPITLYFHPYS